MADCLPWCVCAQAELDRKDRAAGGLIDEGASLHAEELAHARAQKAAVDAELEGLRAKVMSFDKLNAVQLAQDAERSRRAALPPALLHIASMLAAAAAAPMPGAGCAALRCAVLCLAGLGLGCCVL